MPFAFAWIGVVVLGLGCLGLLVAGFVRLVRERRSGVRHWPVWGAMGFSFTLALTGAATLLTIGWQRSDVAARVDAEAKDFAADLQTLLEQAERTIRFAEFALTSGALTAQDESSRLIEPLLAERDELRAITLVDPVEGQVLATWRRPGDSRDADRVSQKDIVALALESPSAGRFAASIVRAPSGRTAIVLAHLIPPAIEGGAAHAVVAEIDAQQAIQTAFLVRHRPLRIVVTARTCAGSTEPIYPSSGLGLASTDEPALRTRVEIGDGSFLVHIWPEGDLREAAVPMVAAYVLGLGLLLGCLVGWIIDDAERRHRKLNLIVEVQDQQLRETERSLEALLEAAPDGVIVIERSEGRVADLNAHACRLLGGSRESMIGRRFAELLTGTDAADPEAVLRRLASPASQADRFLYLQVSGGRRSEAEISAAPILFRGKPSLLLLTHDVSMVERARRLAEKANQAKNELLARIGHEIRTPLDSILGSTRIAIEDEPSPVVMESLQTIERGAQDLLVAVENALDLSRLEAGSRSNVESAFDPRAIVSEALRQLASRARSRGVLLVDDVRRDVPSIVVGDAARLEKILLAVLGAAIARAEGGEVGVIVRPEGAARDGLALLNVLVHGGGENLGFDDAELTEITEATDSQARPMRDTSGPMLGLALAKQALETIGGRLDASGTDEPLRFTLCVPVKLAPSAPAVETAPSLVGRAALIVHPRALVRDSLRETLLTLGVRAVTVADWRPARDAARHAHRQGAPFDVLLADVERLGPHETKLVSTLEYFGSEPKVIAVAERPLPAWPAAADAGIVLPASLALVRRTIDHALRGEEVTTGAEASANATLLVVEDSPINRRLVARALERAGYAVLTAENGQQALETIATHDVQIVLMDIEMPILDGLAATRRLRGLPSGEDLPIIALTARARPEDRDACFAAGMDDFLTKPVDREELKETVSRWLVEDRAALRRERRRAAALPVPV